MQKDRKRHCQSDKFRQEEFSRGYTQMNADPRLSAFIRGFFVFGGWFKSGKTRSFLTRSTFRGEALKERSEGLLAQRQAALRECWRRGTRSTFSSSVSCRGPLSTRRATNILLA